VRSPFRFEGAIRKAVHELKYQNLAAIAAPLAGFMARYLEKEPIEADVLVPVPLHPRRFHDRAFNQSALLAGELGKRLGLPVDEACLIRARFNLPQARTKSLEERRANVAGVFACRGDSARGKRVLLIDDVSTSGATLNACAVALKSGGAKSVSGLTLAREI
jgi:ComF family protein